MITFQYISSAQLHAMHINTQVQFILDQIHQQKILIIEGRLKATQEATLIRRTMEAVEKNPDTFAGIEIGVIRSDITIAKTFREKIKRKLTTMIVGENRGLTIIGPAQIIESIEQEPNKIHVHLNKLFVNNIKRK